MLQTLTNDIVIMQYSRIQHALSICVFDSLYNMFSFRISAIGTWILVMLICAGVLLKRGYVDHGGMGVL